MPARVDSNHISYEKLNESHHSVVEIFRNQEDDLVRFLQDDALANQTLGISVTYLFFIIEKGSMDLAGYITLLSDSIGVHQNSELQHEFEDKGIGYRTLPGIKIGRMATDTRFQRRGIATAMIKFAISVALDISLKVGCRFLIVDSKETAEGFYAKKDFKPLSASSKKPAQMCLDLFMG